jgi:hypothetical protein
MQIVVEVLVIVVQFVVTGALNQLRCRSILLDFAEAAGVHNYQPHGNTPSAATRPGNPDRRRRFGLLSRSEPSASLHQKMTRARNPTTVAVSTLSRAGMRNCTSGVTCSQGVTAML